MALTIYEAFNRLRISHILFEKYLKIEDLNFWVKKNWITCQKNDNIYIIKNEELTNFINTFLDINQETLEYHNISYNTFENLEEEHRWDLFYKAFFELRKEKEDFDKFLEFERLKEDKIIKAEENDEEIEDDDEIEKDLENNTFWTKQERKWAAQEAEVKEIMSNKY